MTEQEHNNVQWRKVKLGDCCSINPKTDISKVQNDDIVSFVKMEDVSNDGFITSFSERPYKSLQKKGFTIFQNDDVIFAKITPCMENGKGALVRNMKSKICMGSTEFHVLRACANVSIDFGTSLSNKFTMSGSSGSITLTNGEGSKSMTLKGQYSSISTLSGSCTYTLHFLREEAPTNPPVCINPKMF